MRKRALRLSSVFIALALVLGAISYFRFLDRYELILLDLRFKARPRQTINPRIAIIEIGDDTLENICKWPLPRDYHATLLKVLSQCQVKAVVFDVLFSDPDDVDHLLVEATKEAGNVYYPYALNLEKIEGNLWQAKEFDARILPELAKACKGKGHANILADIDGKRRRIPLFVNYQDQLMPQLSFRAACDYLEVRPDEIKLVPARFVRLGKLRRIPVDEESSILVNLAGGWKESFRHYSYCDILLSYAQRYAQGADLPEELAELKDAVCFVGLTATGTVDLNPSALEPIYPMLGMHANLFNSIVTGNFLRRLGRLSNIAILYFLSLLTILLAIKTRPLTSLLVQLGLLFSFSAFAFLLFIFAGLWIDLFLPLFAAFSTYLGANLFRYIRELQQRELLEKELSIARNIQQSFLRELPQKLQGANISVDMNTAHHVGGDLYDFIQFPDGRIGMMVGDVSGKGVPAALFMAQVISQFRNLAGISSSAAQTLSRLNQQISRDAKSGLFVTMAYAIYDPRSLKLNVASAGHLPVLLFRDQQPAEKIEVSEGMPIGLIEEVDFSQTELHLQAQDIVVLYSDGVTEARNRKAEEFSEAGIIQALECTQQLTSKEVIERLTEAVRLFVGRAPQHDDITIMALVVE